MENYYLTFNEFKKLIRIDIFQKKSQLLYIKKYEPKGKAVQSNPCESIYVFFFIYFKNIRVLLKLCFLHCAVDEMQGGVQPIEGDDVPDRWIDI